MRSKNSSWQPTRPWDASSQNSRARLLEHPFRLAPHTGHVSNFCGLKGSALEPTQPLHPQYDMDRMRRPIHTGRPAWMHREPPDFMDRVLRNGHAGSLQMRASQNCFAIPACLSTALAVCLERIFPSTGKRRCVIGLYRISWSPLPGRSKSHRCARRISFTLGV